MAYNDLQGKKWMTSVTVGQPERTFQKGELWNDTLENLLRHFNVNCPKFLGMKVFYLRK